MDADALDSPRTTSRTCTRSRARRPSLRRASARSRRTTTTTPSTVSLGYARLPLCRCDSKADAFVCALAERGLRADERVVRLQRARVLPRRPRLCGVRHRNVSAPLLAMVAVVVAVVVVVVAVVGNDD